MGMNDNMVLSMTDCFCHDVAAGGLDLAEYHFHVVIWCSMGATAIVFDWI